MLKQTILGFSALGLLAAGGTWISGETVQLKEATPLVVVADETPDSVSDAAPSGEASPEETAPDAQPAVPGDAGANVQSYSIVTENRIGPDGKQVQKRKVWQNGTLIEEKEEVIEGDGAQLSAEMDGETIPGIISRSEQSGDFPGFPGSMDEMLQGMEENLQGMEEKMNAMFGNMLDEDLQKNLQERMLQAQERAAHARDYANAKRAEILRRFGGAAPVELSEYWIGASVTPVSDETAYQLGLNEGEGLLVREIVPGSPAEKAGLEKYDILLAVGEQPVSSVGQIGQIVDGANGNPLAVSYIRKGERGSVELTPEKRPESQTVRIAPPAVNQAVPEQGAEREQIRVVRPGTILSETQNDSLVTDQPLEDSAPAAAPQADGRE